MQNQDQNSLYRKLYKIVPNNVMATKNRARTWLYGYNPKYDFVVISKTGQIDQIININGLNIALPKELKKIQSIFHWHETPPQFKNKWVDYIEQEFDRREEGFWFMNNGEPTYITGTHYMYLQWTKIDVGHPDFREANRLFYIFWEASKADKRSFGMCYLKIRRSGFSFMSSCEGVNTATITKDSRIGMPMLKKCLQIK